MHKWFWEKFTREEVLSRLASGRFPPVTTTVIYTTVFGEWTPEFLWMVDDIPEGKEDNDLLRAVWGRNKEMPLRWLQRNFLDFVYHELLTPEEVAANVAEAKAHPLSPPTKRELAALAALEASWKESREAGGEK